MNQEISSFSITCRPATAADVPAILGLIKELALFEKAPNEVTNTESQLLDDGFGENPAYKAIVAESKGVVIGFALSYLRYSTWKGKVVYLEDLYVQPAYRSHGVGRRLMEQKIAYTQRLGLPYLVLQVLDWNTNAIRFYERFGASFDPEWTTVRIPMADSAR